MVEVVPHEHLLARARELAAAVVSIPSENVREVRRAYDRAVKLPSDLVELEKELEAQFAQAKRAAKKN